MPQVYDFGDTPAAKLDTSKPKDPPVSTYAGRAMKVLGANLSVRNGPKGAEESAQMRFLLRGDTTARRAWVSGHVTLPQLKANIAANAFPFVCVLDWEGPWKGARLRFYGLAEWQEKHGRAREDNAPEPEAAEETRGDVAEGAELRGLATNGAPGN